MGNFKKNNDAYKKSYQRTLMSSSTKGTISCTAVPHALLLAYYTRILIPLFKYEKLKSINKNCKLFDTNSPCVELQYF